MNYAILLLPILFAIPSCVPGKSAGAPQTESFINRDIHLRGAYIANHHLDVMPKPLPGNQVPRFPHNRLGSNAVVRVIVAINDKGRVDDVQPAVASDKEFIAPVREALMTWKFRPGIKDGKAVGCFGLMPIRFQGDGMHEDEGSPPNGSYYSFNQVDTLPKPIGGRMPKPAYPEAMKASGKSGTVRFVLAVDDKGNARVSRIMESPDPAFSEAIRNVAKQWKFEPAVKDGHKVPSWRALSIRFQP